MNTSIGVLISRQLKNILSKTWIYLRDLTPGFLAKPYEYLQNNPHIVTRSWAKAIIDVPDKEEKQINMLDAWNIELQNAALACFVAGTSFPNQEQAKADAPADLFGKQE